MAAELDLKLFGAIHFLNMPFPIYEMPGEGHRECDSIGCKTPPASSLPTTVSRAAGMALTKAMSKDLGQDNIRVNTVCIGLIRSDQIEKDGKGGRT